MENTKVRFDHHIDCSWQLCPVPILMTEDKIASMRPREVLEITFTDPGAKPDLAAWCRASGHDLVSIRDEKPKSYAYVRKSDG